MSTRTAALVPLLSKPPAGPTGTDRDLLRRFARDRDQTAFAELIRRHGALVHGVCRRMLGNPADAEDACQATFLVLSRKAASGRWQRSVASWLYATARQVALNARTARTRRARHEGKAPAKPQASPLAEITGEELLAILDEELDRLTERYRAPVVLCCVEGLSRDEAASQLGVPAATLKGQLERGRKRLHDALARRGVALGAGLLILLTTSRSVSASTRLVNAIGASVAGRASPAITALAERTAAAGVFKKMLLGLILAVATGVIGLGLGQPRPTTAGPAQDKEMPAKGQADGLSKAKPELKAPVAPGPTVTGRVRSPDGKPLAGAELLLVGSGDPAPLGTTGSDGKFKVQLPAGWKLAHLIARAKDLGIDFVQFGDTEPKGDIELKLVADFPVRGRVVDTEGKPIAGAAVRVDRLGTSPANSLDPVLDLWKKIDSMAADPAGEKQVWSGLAPLWSTTTDKDGSFTFRGLGVERLAVLHINGAGATDMQAFVAIREKFDPKEYNDAVVKNAQTSFGGGKPRWRLYGPNFTAIAEREKLIRGRVFDVDTGKPRVGISVHLTRTDGGNLLQVAPSATTDKDGLYEIHGAKKAGAYMVQVEADSKAGYMQAQAHSGDSSGYDPLTIDVRVKKGVIVTGRLIDKGTGKPVNGFVMIGIPQGNESAKDYPEFNSHSHFTMGSADNEGRFRVVAIPGPILLMSGPNSWAEFEKYEPPVADPKYPQFFKKFGDHMAYYMPGGAISPLQGRVCKVIEIKAGAGTVEQDLELVPAAKKGEKR
jgi:RNA polymerase sigma factor (sigma-70 family)